MPVRRGDLGSTPALTEPSAGRGRAAMRRWLGGAVTVVAFGFVAYRAWDVRVFLHDWRPDGALLTAVGAGRCIGS